ncbi:MAG: GTP 3',8-cyclase MoaA [Clostridiales bacterium]|jgi:cyclic pyranopterin phosphate synthase|nr:GTP 3',8-cyclase MoaA [Clostridiales bacterium]
MLDALGRDINYLRMSITDQCNLRCFYCMPAGWSGRADLLSFEEMLKICFLSAGLGITRVRVTGGEPLLRDGAAKFCKDISLVPGIGHVSLTTNGALLQRHLPELAGVLSSCNISLDTCQAEKYKTITGGGSLDKAMDAIFETLRLGIPVKLNCVASTAFDEQDALDLASLAKDYPLTVRFIELMPIGPSSGATLNGDQIFALLEKRYGRLEPMKDSVGGGPAACFKPKGFAGKIGFISPLTSNFCSSCNRLRLTADGRLKPCLFLGKPVDLKALIRSGASDSELKEAISSAVKGKPQDGCPSKGAVEEGMFRIGG